MFPKITVPIFIWSLVLVSGCDRTPREPSASDPMEAHQDDRQSVEENIIHRAGQPDVITVDSQDAEMNAAIEQSRKTTPAFLHALAGPKPNQEGFAVKRPYVTKDGEGTEHIWISHLTYDGKLLHGTIDDEPVNVLNLKLGDEVAFSPEELSDWMYMEDGKVVGGRTIRVLRKHMSPEEGSDFDKTLQFKD